MNRALITGCGVITALGAGCAALGEAISHDRSGVRPVRGFDVSMNRCRVAAQVPGQVDGSRCDWFLRVAAEEALEQAGLPAPGGWSGPPPRIIQGTAHGALDTWSESPDPCAGLPARLGAQLWNGFGEDVEVTTVTNACVASTVAAGLALGAIRRGDVDCVLVAGAESLTPFLFNGFDSLRSLTLTCCRPFDSRRDGLVLGEGACVLVVESEERVRRRGARVLAELAGFGIAADAHHMTAPDASGKGTAAALRSALSDARIEAPDYINLHGTGTVHNDRMEINALIKVFGERLAGIPISGTKALTGHTSGAAGALEIAICLDALAAGRVPATFGLEEPDPAFTACDLVRGEPRDLAASALISINSAFGGHNAALVLRRWS